MKLIHVSGVDKKPQRLHFKLVTRNTTCILNEHQDHHFTTAEIVDVSIKEKKAIALQYILFLFSNVVFLISGHIFSENQGQGWFRYINFPKQSLLAVKKQSA